MIGDFAKVNKDVCLKKGTIVEVRGIDADNAFREKGLKGCATCFDINDRCESGGIWVVFLEPIPLTPEILEKNGFRLHKFNHDIMRGMWWEIPEFVIRENMLDSVGRNNFQYTYVHQLQHALKLCGFEKEIEL